MKKILSIATMLFCVTAVMAQQTVTVNAEGYSEVWNAQQLKEVIQNDNSARVQLMANIDAAKIGKLCGTFSGIITGKHKHYYEELGKEMDGMYAIYGAHYNESAGSDKTDSWLFDKVEGASFSYIYFANFRVQEEGGSKLGLIAREAVNSSFTSLTFDNVSIYEPDDFAGVIVGTAQTCRFEYINTKFTDVTVDGHGAGTMTGKSVDGTYYMCIVSVTSAVYADGKWAGDALAGGLVGTSDHDNFLGCLNSGLVGGKASKIGGIAGKSVYSQFTSCNNDYAVLFCDETGSKSSKLYFRDLVNNTRQKVNELSVEKKKEIENQISGVAAGALGGGAASLLTGLVIYNSFDVFTAVTEFNSCDLYLFLWYMMNQPHSDYYAIVAAKAAPAIGFFTFTIGLFVAAVVTVIVDAIIVLTDYDEVGGICGCAEYCDFEQCTNHAQLVCDDAFAGGIVGFADGGTINNCLNTGTIYNDGADTRGGILGAPRNKPRVTNCLSTKDYPIIGKDGYRDLSDIDIRSGNNYRYENPDMSNGYSSLEMQVMYNKIGTGVVANWLNNGVENRQQGIRPWRQNLKGSNYDDNPVLDISHDEVLPTNLAHMTIRDEDDLRAFAREVNKSGNNFCNAVLENDIHMTSDQPWTPIGTKDHRWRGVFDGQGHTIYGLKCSIGKDSEEGAGLFGTVDVHADIRNVTLDSSCEIDNKSANGAGAIVGTVRNDYRGWGYVLVHGCGNHGDVSGYQHVGGILGRVINDDNDGDGSQVQVVVDNCFNTGEVRADGYSALICGYMQDYGHVQNCWSGGLLLQSGDSRVFSMNNPSGEAEYFVGYDSTLDISGCFDFRSDVDWHETNEAKQNQKGVTKNSEIDVNPDATLVYRRKVSVPVGEELAYGTICLPFTLKSDDKLKFYTFKEGADIDGNVVFRFEDVDTLQAGTPAMFSYTESTNTLEFVSADNTFKGTPSVSEDALTKWKFVGTYAPIHLDEGRAYILSYKDKALKFRLNNAGNLGACRAYITSDDMPSTLNAKECILQLGDETPTAIFIPTTDSTPVDNQAMYNMQGQRVTESFKGIVIKGNRKYIK